jgi:hypothetical protein
MRDNGVDGFPDPVVTADGSIDFDFQSAFQSGEISPGDAVFRTAIEECQPLVEGAGFGPGTGRDVGEVQDVLLQYTGCLRDEGLDVGDLTFDGPPGADGEADGDGGRGAFRQGRQGANQGPGGFIADALGVDADDPAFIAANEVCQPILAEAFQGGPGGGAGAGEQ